jgi:serine/threonine protein phosphatase PrpC
VPSVTAAIAAATTPGAPKGGTTSVSRVAVAEEMNAKYRATMEDAYTIVDGYGGDPATGFFGVYDGHGGQSLPRGTASFHIFHVSPAFSRCQPRRWQIRIIVLVGDMEAVMYGAGREVSEYLRRQLHKNLEKVLREQASKGVEECLKAAFVMTGM